MRTLCAFSILVSDVRRKFPRGVLGGSGACPGKFCKITPKNMQITPKNTHLHLKMLFIFFYFKGLRGGAWHSAPPPYASDSCVV